MLEAAATLIHSQLQVAPRQFGDPTYSLKSSQLDVFVRGVRPVIVHFAVHRTENLVIVKSIDWVGPASE